MPPPPPSPALPFCVSENGAFPHSIQHNHSWTWTRPSRQNLLRSSKETVPYDDDDDSLDESFSALEEELRLIV